MVSVPVNDSAESFELARGAHVGIVKPEDGFESRIPVTWEEFATLVCTFTVSESKVGEYICRPMGGDGTRSDANAQPWPVLPLDLDEMLPEDLSELEKWCESQGLALVIASTFSHTAESPRVRVWVRCSRAFSAVEHLYLFRAFAQGTFFPFKLDPATAKPSQPIYLPRCPAARKHLAFAREFEGKLLDVDGVLKGFQEEMRELENRNKKGRFIEGKGVRVPGGTIDAFNRNFNLPELLEAHGYKRRTRNRFIAPGSKSGRAAIVLHEWGLMSFHEPSHDPLALRTKFGTPRVLDAFAAYSVLEHDDEFIPAFKAALRLVKAHGWEAPEGSVGSAPMEGFVIKPADKAMLDLKPREMIVQGVLEKGTTVVITGQSNSGKTTVLQYMVYCIGMGVNFGAHPVVRSRVLWIAGEDAYNAQLRFGAMCSEYGTSIKELGEWVYVLPQPIAVMKPVSMEAFHAAVEKYMPAAEPFQVVVVDSKSMCWGGEDENSNDENAQFVQELANHFTLRYGASVLLTHHLTKNKEKEEQTARGASALINNIDHEWRFEMRPTTMTSIMEPGTKLRIARWEPMRFAVKVVEAREADYPWLKNSQGDMPKISIAEATNKYGMMSKQQQQDAEFVSIIRAIQGLDAKSKRHINDSIAKALGKLQQGASKPDALAAREWVRIRVGRMKEQMMLDKDAEVTKAGAEFAEQFERELAMLAEQQAAEGAEPEADE